MAASGKQSTARKVTAPRRTPAAAAAPVAEVEEQPVKRRPGRPRKATAAAAAMRAGDPADTPQDVAPVEADGEEPETKTAVVLFNGRNLVVKMPNTGQLTMYRRLSREFTELAESGRADEIEMDVALKYLDRAVRLVQSVLKSDDDREWIEDRLLDGAIDLHSCNGLLATAFKMLKEANEEQQTGNRATRRAAGSARLAD